MSTREWLRVLSRAELLKDDILLIRINLDNAISLSTTVVNGGLRRGINYVIFKRVSNDFREDPTKYSMKLINELGIGNALVFLTANDVGNYVRSSSCCGNLCCEVYLTIGLNEYPTCSYPKQNYWRSKDHYIGTINTLVITNYGLSEVGITDLLRLVSEVKSALVSSVGYSCLDSRACGTSSDATAVISNYGTSPYAGSATELGNLVIEAMYKVFSSYLSKLSIQDYITYLLGGIKLNDLINLAIKAYEKAPIPNLSAEKFKEEFTNELMKLLNDVNVLLMIRSFRCLDEVAHLTKGLSREEYELDTKAVITDELLGHALANYVGGFKALLNYYWLERLKEKGVLGDFIKSLPMFLDDLINSLVGSVMSRVYSKYLSP